MKKTVVGTKGANTSLLSGSHQHLQQPHDENTMTTIGLLRLSEI